MPPVLRLAPLSLFPLAVAAALALPASANEYHVDAAVGQDVPSGGTAQDPWKTISYATSQVGGPGVTIHVAPGTYDAALGETFPIPLTSGESLIGAGSNETMVVGEDADEVLFAFVTTIDPSAALLEGFTLRRAGIGIRVDTWVPEGGLTMRDVRFRGLRAAGAEVRSSLVLAEPVFESCRFERCSIGLLLTTISTSPEPVLRDCTFLRCDKGVVVSSWSHEQSGFSQPKVHLVRSIVRDCRIGIELLELDANSIARLEGCLVTGCDEAIRYTGVTDVVLVQSTVAGNVAGLVVPPAPDNDVYTTLQSSIVWGQSGVNLDPDEGLYFGGFSDTDPLAPLPNCLSVPPGFVDPAAGDFGLSSDSPLIDQGDPAAATAGTDLDLDPRVLDGDGDGLARVDMGFDEQNLTHLSHAGPARLGQTLELDVAAPSGQVFLLWLAPLSGDLFLGPYGSLLLDPVTAVFLTAGASPGSVHVPIPASPELAGLAILWQALSFELADPSVGSFSNRLELVVSAR